MSWPQSEPTGEFSQVHPSGVLDSLLSNARRKIVGVFLKEFGPLPSDLILDVGTSPNPELEASNSLLKTTLGARIHACGIDPHHHTWLQRYPDIAYTQADACCLPFPDASFDYVHCNAVIEHVGDETRQVRLIAECTRVARKGVFITSPNRWHPIDFHTLVPILHWFPKKVHRKALTALGMPRYADPMALNLLDRSELQSIAWRAVNDVANKFSTSTGPLFNCRVENFWFLGLPSNVLLIVHIKR